ncbi:MAG: hypothetical protein Q4F05_00345 [bacterium]|nr:hypothetical protein [bacterium]
MQLLIVILKRESRMKKMVQELAKSGVRGGTILEGTGMAESLVQMQDLPVFGTLKRMLSVEEFESSHVMLFALKDEQLKKTTTLIKEIVGDFNEPNTGIMFAVPISYIEGLS